MSMLIIKKIKLSVLLPFGRYEQSSLHDIGVIERHLKMDEIEAEKKRISNIDEMINMKRKIKWKWLKDDNDEPNIEEEDKYDK